MKALLLLVCALSLAVLSGCSDDDCPICPDAETPDAPTFSMVGYWEAVECEGISLADEPYRHSITFRRDLSYLEYDSVLVARTTVGTYEHDGEALTLTPADGSSGCGVWACRVTADTMTWCYCSSDHTPAWVYVRSTEN